MKPYDTNLLSIHKRFPSSDVVLRAPSIRLARPKFSAPILAAQHHPDLIEGLDRRKFLRDCVQLVSW